MKYLMMSITMRYFDLDEISPDIYNYEMAKLYYTSLSLGCWDEIGMHGYHLGSIPTCCHPKPRPSTPMDLFDISIVLYQKEFFE